MRKSLNKLPYVFELDHPIDNWSSIGWYCIFDDNSELKPIGRDIAKLVFESIFKLNELGEMLCIREGVEPSYPYDIHIANYSDVQMVGIKLDEDGRTLIFSSLDLLQNKKPAPFFKYSNLFEENKITNIKKIN